MRIQSRCIFFSTLALAAMALSAAVAEAQAPVPKEPSAPSALLPAVASLVAAESEFAAHAVATDMRTAFIRALGKDGILLRPTPVPGATFMAARPAPPIELNWRPTFAHAAASGDFGITTGPWRITSRADANAPPSYGHFVSLWKRLADGAWQVAFDTGISHATPAGADAFLVAPAAVAHRADSAKAAASIAKFVSAVTAGDYAAALRRYAASDVRVYRDRVAPYVGRASLEAMTAEWAGHSIAALPTVSGQSQAGDLLWRLSQIRAPGSEAKLVSHAFTVWRAKADGDIEIILDVTTDMPKVP
jgi:ketosteroid isomerase-like protein